MQNGSLLVLVPSDVFHESIGTVWIRGKRRNLDPKIFFPKSDVHYRWSRFGKEHHSVITTFEIKARINHLIGDFKDDQKKSVRGLLTLMLVQLEDQSDAYSTILSDFYLAHGRASQHASNGELLDCFHKHTNSFGAIHSPPRCYRRKLNNPGLPSPLLCGRSSIYRFQICAFMSLADLRLTYSSLCSWSTGSPFGFFAWRERTNLGDR